MAAGSDGSKGLPEVYLSPSRKFKKLNMNKTFTINDAISTHTDVWDDSDTGDWKVYVPVTSFIMDEDRNVGGQSIELKEDEVRYKNKQYVTTSADGLNRNSLLLDEQEGWRSDMDREELNRELLGASAPNTPIKGLEEGSGENEGKNMSRNVRQAMWSHKRGETPGSDNLGVGGFTGSKVLRNSGNVGINMPSPLQNEHLYLPGGSENLLIPGGLHTDYDLASSETEDIDWLSGQGSWSGCEAADRDTVGPDGAPAAVYPPRSIGTSTAQLQRNSPAGLSTPDVDVDVAAQVVSSTISGQQVARPPVVGQSEDVELSSRKDLGSTDGEESEQDVTRSAPVAGAGETHSYTGIQQSSLGSLSENTDSANTVLSREEVQGCETQVKSGTRFPVSTSSGTLSPRAQGFTKPNFVVGGAISPRGQFQQIQNTVRGRMQDLKASLEIQPEREGLLSNDREHFLSNAPLFQNYISVGEQEVSLTSMISVESTQHPESSERVTSPSVLSVSSVASSKKLEWDSGADVGYAGVQPEQSSASLSTLERIAIGSYASVLRTEPEGTTYVKDKQKFNKSSKNVAKSSSELKPEVKKALMTKKYSDSIGSRAWRMQQFNIASSSEDSVPSKGMNSSQSPRRKPRRRSTLAEARQDSAVRRSSKSRPQSANRVKQVILEARREGKSSSLVELSQPPLELQEHNRSTSQQTIDGTKKLGSVVESSSSLTRHSSLGTVTGSSISVVTAVESCVVELEKPSHSNNSVANATSPVQGNSLIPTSAPVSPVKRRAESPAKVAPTDVQKHCHGNSEDATEKNVVSERQISLSSYSSIESGRSLKTSATENLSDAKDTVDSSSTSPQPTDEDTGGSKCRNGMKNANVASRTLSSSGESTTKDSETSVPLSEINRSLQCLSQDLSNRIKQLISEGSFKKVDDYQKLQEYINFIGIPSNNVEDCRLKQSIASVIMRMFMEVNNVDCRSVNESQASSSPSCDTVEASVVSSATGSHHSIPSTSTQGSKHTGQLCEGGKWDAAQEKQCTTQEKQGTAHEEQNTSHKKQCATQEERGTTTVHTVVVPYWPTSASRTYYMAVAQESVESGVEADCREPGETTADLKYGNQSQQVLPRGETVSMGGVLQGQSSQEYIVARTEMAAVTSSAKTPMERRPVAYDEQSSFPNHEKKVVELQPERITYRISGETGSHYDESGSIGLESTLEADDRLQDSHDQHCQDSQPDIRMEGNDEQQNKNVLIVDSVKLPGKKEITPEARLGHDGNVDPEKCPDRNGKVSENDPDNLYDWRNRPTKSERRFYKDRRGTLHIAHQPPGYAEDKDSHPSESLSEQEIASRNTAASSTCYETAEASRAWSSTGSESAYETIRERHRHVDEALASSFEFYSTSPREARFLEYMSVDNTPEQQARAPLGTVTSPQDLVVNISAGNTELPFSRASELPPPSVPPSSSVTDTLSSPGQVWSPQDQWDGAHKGGNTALSSPSSNQYDISSQLSLIHEQKLKYVHKLQNIVPYIQQIQSLELIERVLREQFRGSVSLTEGNDSNTLGSPAAQGLSGTATSSIVSSDFSEGNQISWSSGQRKRDVILKETTTSSQHGGRSSRVSSAEFSSPSFSALKEMEEEVKKLKACAKMAVESTQNTLRYSQRNERQSNKVFIKQSESQQPVTGKHKEDTDISSYAPSYDTASSSRDRMKEIRDRAKDKAKQLGITGGHCHMSQQSLSSAFRVDTDSVGYPVRDDALSSSVDLPRQSNVTSTVESISDDKTDPSSHTSRHHKLVVRDIPSGERPSRTISDKRDVVTLLSKEKGRKTGIDFDRGSTDFEDGHTSSTGQYVSGGYAALSARQSRDTDSLWPWSTTPSTGMMEKGGNAERDDFVTSTLKKMITERIDQKEIGFGIQSDLTDAGSRDRSDLADVLQGRSNFTYALQGTSELIDGLLGRSDLTDVLQGRSDLTDALRGRGDLTDDFQRRSELTDSLQGRQTSHASEKETYSSNRAVSSKNLYRIDQQNEGNFSFTNEGQPSGFEARLGCETGQSLGENADEKEEGRNDKKDFSQMFPSFLLDPGHIAQQFHNVGVQTGRSILQDDAGSRSLDEISLEGISRGNKYKQQPSKIKSKHVKDERHIAEKERHEKNAKILDAKQSHGKNKRPSSAKESHHRTKTVIERRSSSASRTELESGSVNGFSSSDVYVEKVQASPIFSRKTTKFKDKARGMSPRSKHGGNVQIVPGRWSHKSRRPSSAKESQHRTRIDKEERSSSVSRTNIVSGSLEELSSPDIRYVEDSPSSKRRGDHSSAMKEVNRRTKSERRIHESRRPSSAKERQQLKVIRECRSSSASGRSSWLESESHSLSLHNNNSQLSSTSSTLEQHRNKVGQKLSNRKKQQSHKVSVEPQNKENERSHTRLQRKTIISEVEELGKEKGKGKEKRTASRTTEETFKYATSKQHRNVRVDISYSSTSSSVERISLVTTEESHSLLPKGTEKQDPIAFTVPLGDLESLSDIDPEMKVWWKENKERMKSLGIEMPKKPVLSLQEALAMARPGYIRCADRRRAFMRVKRDMRKEASDLNKRVILEMPSKMDASPNTLKSCLYRPKMKPLFSYKEIREQNRKLYQNLPETKNPIDAHHRKALYRTNRVMASFYSQQLKKKVLTGKVSHAHKNIITPTR